jgi:hypothetical protein
MEDDDRGYDPDDLPEGLGEVLPSL